MFSRGGDLFAFGVALVAGAAVAAVPLVFGMGLFGWSLLMVGASPFIALGLLFSFQSLILEGRGPSESIGRSWELTEGHRPYLFLLGMGLNLFRMGVPYVFVRICSLSIESTPFMNYAMKALMAMLVDPLLVSIVTFAYFNQRVRNEPRTERR